MTVLRALLEITVYSAALFGAILLFRAVFRKKASPALLYAAWFVLIVRLLIPVTIGGVSLIVLPAQETPAQQALLPPAADSMTTGGQAVTQPPYSVTDEAWTAEQYVAGETHTNAAAAPRIAVREFGWVTMWVALWTAGMTAMLVNIAVAFGRLNRRLAIAPALPERWQEMAQRLKQELGVRRHVRFVMLGSFASPALSASLRPAIVMPMELVWQEDEAMIEFALRHELMHIKRGDHWVCLLLMLLKAVYWFNPIVWLASRLMKMDMETACDSMVVQPMDDETKKQYAATILDMYAKAQPRFVLGMAPGHTRHTAEKRVRGIFMRRRSGRGTVAAALILAAVMVMACFTTACQPVTEAAAADTETPIQTAAVSLSPLGDETMPAAAGGETDILMIGVDNRDPEKFTGQSDVMMYLRVNTGEKTIKAALFMRDTLVDIEGHGKGKLNAAYSYGGIDLVYSTLEDNFGLTPDYYMVVNFYGMETIINALGGVEVSVEKDELEWLNININDINMLDPSGKVSNISEPGDNHLNGRQAVAYMRIRHPGGDAGRIERQQTVINALFAEMRNVSADEIPGMLGALIQYVRTDMPLESMINLGAAVQGISGDDLQTFRYPENFVNSNYNGSAVVTPENFTTEYAKLCDFLGCSVVNSVLNDGDFGAGFSDKFTDGEVIQTEDTYQSRNVNISINKVSKNDVTYYVADIYIRNLEYLQTAFADDRFGNRAATDKIAKGKGAILAVNGDNCIDTSGSVVRNGVLYRDDTDTSDMLVLNKDGTMQTYSPENFDLEDSKDEAWQIWTFGPMLLQNGQPMAEFNSTVGPRNPRTAIGYYEPGHYCFVVVDGRHEGYSVGMTLSELSQLFYDLGCTVAFNLDGGNSSEMVYQDSIVNQPCNGGRSTGDIVYIRDQA